jgi:hypothetical protein
MLQHSKLVRGALLAALILTVGAGVGYGAPSGVQTVSVAVNSAISITVPGTAAIAGTDPGVCGTTASTINVKANRTWNLQIRSDPVNNPAGQAMNGVTPMVNVFQYNGGGVVAYTNITSTYASLYGAPQARTTATGTNVAMNYQQCVDWMDNPGTYTITVDYLGI